MLCQCVGDILNKTPENCFYKKSRLLNQSTLFSTNPNSLQSIG